MNALRATHRCAILADLVLFVVDAAGERGRGGEPSIHRGGRRAVLA
jgi:hypothetical protein